FNLNPNASSQSPKGIEVDSNNGNPIIWTATQSSGGDWLSLVTTSGSNGDEVTFNASADGLTPGIRNATVTVSASGFAPRSFTVTMNVLAVGSCPAPDGGDVTVGVPFSTSFTASSGSV